MSLWASYAKERLGIETIETERGFITFQIERFGTALICDLFVHPDHRLTGELRSLFDAFVDRAKAAECIEVCGNIWPALPGATEMFLIVIKAGFKVVPSQDGAIRVSRGLHGK